MPSRLFSFLRTKSSNAHEITKIKRNPSKEILVDIIGSKYNDRIKNPSSIHEEQNHEYVNDNPRQQSPSPRPFSSSIRSNASDKSSASSDSEFVTAFKRSLPSLGEDVLESEHGGVFSAILECDDEESNFQNYEVLSESHKDLKEDRLSNDDDSIWGFDYFSWRPSDESSGENSWQSHSHQSKQPYGSCVFLMKNAKNHKVVVWNDQDDDLSTPSADKCLDALLHGGFTKDYNMGSTGGSNCGIDNAWKQMETETFQLHSNQYHRDPPQKILPEAKRRHLSHSRNNFSSPSPNSNSYLKRNDQVCPKYSIPEMRLEQIKSSFDKKHNHPLHPLKHPLKQPPPKVYEGAVSNRKAPQGHQNRKYSHQRVLSTDSASSLSSRRSAGSNSSAVDQILEQYKQKRLIKNGKGRITSHSSAPSFTQLHSVSGHTNHNGHSHGSGHRRNPSDQSLSKIIEHLGSAASAKAAGNPYDHPSASSEPGQVHRGRNSLPYSQRCINYGEVVKRHKGRN